MSDLAPAPTSTAVGHQPVATLTDLEIRVSDGPVLLPATSAQIHAGQVTALMGASGSGKTTLLRALIGHLPRALPSPAFWTCSAAPRTSCPPRNCALCAAPPSPTSARTPDRPSTRA